MRKPDDEIFCEYGSVARELLTLMGAQDVIISSFGDVGCGDTIIVDGAEFTVECNDPESFMLAEGKAVAPPDCESGVNRFESDASTS